MRRRSSQLGISLFSFQDIIISVTGILILMVLLLALQLTQSVSDSTREALEKSSRELKTELSELSQQINELTGQLEESAVLVQQATENPRGQLNQTIGREQVAIVELKDDISTLEDVSEEITSAESDAEATATRTSKMRSELSQVRGKIESIEEELDILRDGQATQYVAPQGVTSDRSWLCEVSASGLKLTPFAGEGNVSTFLSRNLEADQERLMKSLRGWIGATTPQPRYILFLIRPSGIEFSSAVNFEGPMLGVPFGIELISETHTILNES